MQKFTGSEQVKFAGTVCVMLRTEWQEQDHQDCHLKGVAFQQVAYESGLPFGNVLAAPFFSPLPSFACLT